MAVPSVLVPQGQGTAHNDHDRDGGDVSDDKDFVEPIMPTEEGKAVYEAMVREVAGRGYGFVHGVPSGAGFDDVPQAGLSTAETDKDKGGKGKQTGVESVIPSGCGYILFYEATTIDTWWLILIRLLVVFLFYLHFQLTQITCRFLSSSMKEIDSQNIHEGLSKIHLRSMKVYFRTTTSPNTTFLIVTSSFPSQPILNIQLGQIPLNCFQLF